MATDTDNQPLGQPEVAILLGVSRDTVRQWRYRNLMPPADYEAVNLHPAWRRETITTWAVQGNRLGADHQLEPWEVAATEAS